MPVAPIGAETADLIGIIVVPVHENDRRCALAQDPQRLGRTFAPRGKIPTADQDIRVPARFDDRPGRRLIAVKIGKCQNTHMNAYCLEYLRRAAPKSVVMVENTFARSRRSLRKNTPISSAKTMDVSRSAVTRAMGACVKAHVTKP